MSLKVIAMHLSKWHESEQKKAPLSWKTTLSLTCLCLTRNNCEPRLFDNTAGDQRSGLVPEEVFPFSIGLLNVPEGNILINMA